MSRIRADRVTDRAGTGSPLFPNGIRVVGLTSLSNVIAGVTTFSNNVHLLDSDRLQIGGSAGTVDGIELYHDGSHSYIADSGTGELSLAATTTGTTISGLTYNSFGQITGSTALVSTDIPTSSSSAKAG